MHPALAGSTCFATLCLGLAASAADSVLDGRFDDWATRSDAAAAFADGAYVWFRLALPAEFTLQGGSRTTSLALDLDANAATGQRRGDGDSALGVDLEILLAPPTTTSEKRDVKPGLEVRHYEDGGLFTRESHAKIGFGFAPTYAAPEYELRIARDNSLGEPAGSRFRAATRVRAKFTVSEGGQEWFAGPLLDIALPPRTDSSPSTSALPRKPDGAVRLVSWNVEWEGPEKNPPPFRRVLTALGADVLHLQEWKIDEKSLVAWFSANLPSSEPWRAHTYKDLGVAIVSRLPLTPLTTARLVPDRDVDGKKRSAIRFVAARIESPIGPLLAGSMHLKCCGSMDTYEDRLRIAQTETIGTFLRSVLSTDSALRPLLSGDLNLVGSRRPLDVLADALDTDGSDLGVADARVFGGDAAYTWNDAESPFSPGRLDYALYADAEYEIANAFVFDAARLAPETRAGIGLEANDQLASDHRPLVVDLRKKDATVAAPTLIDKTGAEVAALAADGSHELTVVNLWATWCVPCVKELPDLLRATKERSDRVRLVLVSCDAGKDRAKAAGLLSRLGVDFTTYLKSGSDAEFIAAIAPDWGGALPLTLVFDRNGKKIRQHEGQASYEEFSRLLDP